MSDQDRLFDIKEAARFLNVSETSLRRWTNSGRLVCLRIGRRRERRFRRSDLLAFVERDSPADPASARAVRPSGHTISGSRGLEPGAHLCALYDADQDRVRLAVDFLADGLQGDGVCFVFGTEAVRTTIVSGLERREPSLGTHIEAGRLVSRDFATTPSAQLELLRSQFSASMEAGARSIRFVGDVAGFAARIGSTAVMEYERAYATTIANRFPVVTLCQYDARYFSGVDLVGALRTHPDTLQHPQRVL